VVRRTVQVLPAQSGVEVSLALGEGLPPVCGDADRLRQVFLNIALNALEAMVAGGKLTISTALRGQDRGGEAQPLVEIRFRDTGAGFPPSELRNLFIPFHTTKPKGTGLGLAISQRIVEIHGGRIEARSRLGAGATFAVLLPAAGRAGKAGGAAADSAV
jgi:signal transduction histidine kinase